MLRQVTVTSMLPPDVVAANLRAAVGRLPSGGRSRPSHVTGVEVQINLPQFSLQYSRTYREFSGRCAVEP